MMCPVCRYEYKENIKKCPDCGAALESVKYTEPESKPVSVLDKNDLVSAGLFDDLAEFEVLKKYLEEEKIFYHTVDHTPSKESMRGHAHLARFPVSYELFVEEKRITDARQLIDDIREAKVDISDMRWQETEPNPDIETAELCQVETDLEASVMRDILMQEGIYSFARNNVLPFTNVIMSFFNRKGKVTIIVNKEDLEKARKIIKEL